MATRIFLLLLILLCSNTTLAIDKDLHERVVELKKAQPSAQQQALSRLVNARSEQEMRQRTKRVESLLRSQQFQTSVDAHKSWLLDVKGIDSNSIAEADASETAILFISASIPMSTLRNYASVARKHNTVMVIKGMVGSDPSKLAPTLEFFRKVLVEDLDCDTSGCPILNVKIAVDPGRFNFYNVHQVPALVVEAHSDFIPVCQGGSQYNPVGQVVYGDAALTDLIKLSKKGGSDDKE